MSDDPKISDLDQMQPSNREQGLGDWTTGDVPASGDQASFAKTLCEEAGEAFEPGLIEADALKRIEALSARTGR